MLARLLRVEDFGLMAIVNVVLAFSQAFGDAGVSNAIIHYRDARREELSSLYWLNVLAGAAVFAVVWALSPLLASFYQQSLLTDLLRVSSVVFVVVPFGQLFQVLLERELRFRRIAVIETVATVASAVVGIVMAVAGYGVWSLVWAAIVYAVVRSLVLAAVGWSEFRPMPRLVPRECRRFVHFGLYQMGERTLNLLGQHLDKLIIGAIMGPRALGYYELAYRLIARPYQAINPIFTRVAFPVFSVVQKDRDRLRKGFLELIEVVAAMVTPLYLLMLVLAAPLVRVQLGPGYEPTVELLQILCVLGLGLGIGSPMGSLLLACGRADLGFFLNLLRTGLVLLGIWLGSKWGLVGISWALVIVSIPIMYPVGVWVRWRLVGMRVGEYVAHIAPYLGSGLAAAIVTALVHRVVPWPNAAVELMVPAAVGAGVYLAALYTFARWRLQRIVALVRS